MTIIAGETSVDYIAFTVDDGVQESDETFTATLSNPVNATLGDAIGTATIIDSDHKAQAVAQRKYQKLRHADAAEPPKRKRSGLKSSAGKK